MRLGIFARTFAGANPQSVLAAAAKAGYQAVQYNMACSGVASMPDAVPVGSAEAIRAASEATGVAVVAICATYNMIHPDLSVRERGHASLERIAAVARDLGSPLLTLCTGTRDPDDQWRHHPDNATPQAWRDLLTSMETAVGIADRFGVDLGIEPEMANVIDSADQAGRTIDEIGRSRIRVVLDPANLFERAAPALQRVIIADGIALLSDRIAMVHAKDRNAHGGFVTAGTGVLDYPFYLRQLIEAGFTGPLVTHGLAETEASSSARFLSNQLGKAEPAS